MTLVSSSRAVNEKFSTKQNSRLMRSIGYYFDRTPQSGTISVRNNPPST